MRLFLSLALSLSAGWALSSATKASPAPVPPEHWRSSALLEAFSRTEEGLFEEMFGDTAGGPIAAYRELIRKGGDERAATKAQRILGAERIILEGTLLPAKKERAAGGIRLRVACPGQGKDCCPVLLTRAPAQGEYRERQSSSSLAGSGYLNERGNFVYTHHVHAQPFRENLPFAGALWEIPLAGGRRTPFVAYDPDTKAWRELGQVLWEKRPLARWEECQW